MKRCILIIILLLTPTILFAQIFQGHLPPPEAAPIIRNQPATTHHQTHTSAPEFLAIESLTEQIQKLQGRIETLEHQLHQLQKPTTTETARKKTQAPISTIKIDPVESLYNDAFAKLGKQQYSDSGIAFLDFIERYPNHELTPNAYYWLGETYYVQQQYQQAAIYFLDGYKLFPKAPKAAGNLLKLSLALGALGKPDQACATLKKIKDSFPKASNAIATRTDQELIKNSCS